MPPVKCFRDNMILGSFMTMQCNVELWMAGNLKKTGKILIQIFGNFKQLKSTMKQSYEIQL